MDELTAKRNNFAREFNELSLKAAILASNQAMREITQSIREVALAHLATLDSKVDDDPLVHHQAAIDQLKAANESILKSSAFLDRMADASVE